MHIEEPATRPELSVESLQREQLQSQETLENSKQLLISLQIALSNTGLGLWEWNLVSSHLTFDSGSERILGYKRDEIYNIQSFEKLIHPHDISRVIQKRNQYLLQNRTSSHEVEFRILSKSGWKWIIERAVAKLHDHNSHACVIGTYEDVTELHYYQECARQYQAREMLLQRVTKLIDSSDLSKLETTLSAVVYEVQQFLNTTLVVIDCINGDNATTASDSLILSSSLHYTASDSPTSSLTVPILIRNFAPTNGATTSESIACGTLVALCDSDKLAYLQTEINTLKQIALVIGNAVQQAQLQHSLQTEIRARKEAEAQANERLAQIHLQSTELAQIQKQLLKKEKTATLGELIVDLVKEIYNPVEFLNNTLFSTSQYAEDLIQLLEYYERCYPISPPFPPHLQSLDINFIKTDLIKLLWSLRAGSERLQKTVSALYNFSHDDSQTKKTDLNAALNGAITILQHRLKQQPNRPGIEVVKQFGDIPLVECIPGELNQVFISLITNAIEALEERIKYDHSFMPQICISTELVLSHLSLITSTDASAFDKQKQKVLIHISDNGKGILPHIQRRIFEPFFTTKPFGKGTGLGLAISRQIIEENHRGKLRCNSQLGHGTEFLIEISTKDKHYADIRKRASF